MWNWLRWYHAIPAYYWEGIADLHHTGEGGVDYTFLACGAPFQMQLEAPPYQFEYERNWFAQHGSGINHVCWIVPNAYDTVEHLQSNGAAVAMEYEEFGGTYNGFVAIDPEGRWVEIMEYVNDFKTPTWSSARSATSGCRPWGRSSSAGTSTARWSGTKTCWGCERCWTPAATTTAWCIWPTPAYPARRCVNVLATPGTDAEQAMMDEHGPVISSILYEAADVDQAWADAVAAGFGAISAPAPDDRIGVRTGYLREPSGNIVQVREPLAA